MSDPESAHDTASTPTTAAAAAKALDGLNDWLAQSFYGTASAPAASAPAASAPAAAPTVAAAQRLTEQVQQLTAAHDPRATLTAVLGDVFDRSGQRGVAPALVAVVCQWLWPHEFVPLQRVLWHVYHALSRCADLRWLHGHHAMRVACIDSVDSAAGDPDASSVAATATAGRVATSRTVAVQRVPLATLSTPAEFLQQWKGCTRYWRDATNPSSAGLRALLEACDGAFALVCGAGAGVRWCTHADADDAHRYRRAVHPCTGACGVLVRSDDARRFYFHGAAQRLTVEIARINLLAPTTGTTEATATAAAAAAAAAADSNDVHAPGAVVVTCLELEFQELDDGDPDRTQWFS